MNGPTLLQWIPTLLAGAAIAVAWGRFTAQMEASSLASKELRDQVGKLTDAVHALGTRVEVIDALRATSPGRGLPQ